MVAIATDLKTQNLALGMGHWFAKTLADFEINEIAAALPAPVLS